MHKDYKYLHSVSEEVEAENSVPENPQMELELEPRVWALIAPRTNPICAS
jgi:hypothetical protein